MRIVKIFALTTFLIAVAFNLKAQQVRFVLLPDTQNYVESYPEILESQISWILKNADSIDFVLQQGDLTQINSNEEWIRVQKAFSKLNDIVPYSLVVGNHDMGSAPRKIADVRNTTLFNTYFPYEKMSILPGFRGAYRPDKMDNTYYSCEAGGHNWLILNLEFGTRNAVLEWANNIVAQNPERTVIINTHSYMYSDSTRQGEGDLWRPQGYGIGKDTGADAVNDGEQIWQKLVKKHPNIRFVFSGHVLNSGAGTLISVNEAGYPVYQFLANYQGGVKGSVKGGNGYLRIMDIDIEKNTLRVRTYSPYISAFKVEEGHDFKINHVILND